MQQIMYPQSEKTAQQRKCLINRDDHDLLPGKVTVELSF